jgi:hypothetical protein
MNNAAAKVFASADAVVRALDQLGHANWLLADAHYALARCEEDGAAEARGAIAAGCAALAFGDRVVEGESVSQGTGRQAVMRGLRPFRLRRRFRLQVERFNRQSAKALRSAQLIALRRGGIVCRGGLSAL